MRGGGAREWESINSMIMTVIILMMCVRLPNIAYIENEMN